MDAVALFLEATVRTATPLAFAALSETVSERAGIINLGLQGAIIAGAFGALVCAGAGGVTVGFAGAAAAGFAVAAIFALFTVGLRTDQIITGMAVTLLALGATGTLYRTMYGVAGSSRCRNRRIVDSSGTVSSPSSTRAKRRIDSFS